MEGHVIGSVRAIRGTWPESSWTKVATLDGGYNGGHGEKRPHPQALVTYRHGWAMKERKSQGDPQPAELMGRWAVMILPGTRREHWGKAGLRGGL